jgi:hypothetical protein
MADESSLHHGSKEAESEPERCSGEDIASVDESPWPTSSS